MSGNRNKVFTCKEDVWEIIDLLIEETKEANEKGKEFDIAKSVNAQLPFFLLQKHCSLQRTPKGY